MTNGTQVLDWGLLYVGPVRLPFKVLNVERLGPSVMSGGVNFLFKNIQIFILYDLFSHGKKPRASGAGCIAVRHDQAM